MEQKRRWYDSHEEAVKAFEILKSMDSESRKRISKDLVEIIAQIKELRKEESDTVLSLGIERVLGLYQQSANSRRWYDNNSDLRYALKTLSTLPEEDFLNIMEGLADSINS
ncbi:hypothetical protein IJG72_05655 [bacterium]|nr:hypothetical protein [bacterium]